MTHPLDLDTTRIIYDTVTMTALIYKGDGVVSVIDMILVDELSFNSLAMCDGNFVYVKEEFIIGIQMEYGRYMTMVGDFSEWD